MTNLHEAFFVEHAPPPTAPVKLGVVAFSGSNTHSAANPIVGSVTATKSDRFIYRFVARAMPAPTVMRPLTGTGFKELQKQQFQYLAAQWKRGTAGMSSIDSKMSHAAMREILQLKDVVPLIIDELRVAGGHWFAALRILTNANPVAASDRGNVEAMRKAWLAWADQHLAR